MFKIAYSPPKKSTVIISLILLLIGIILGVIAFLGEASTLLPFLELFGLTAEEMCLLICFALSFLAWLLMYLGVKLRGF